MTVHAGHIGRGAKCRRIDKGLWSSWAPLYANGNDDLVCHPVGQLKWLPNRKGEPRKPGLRSPFALLLGRRSFPTENPSFPRQTVASSSPTIVPLISNLQRCLSHVEHKVPSDDRNFVPGVSCFIGSGELWRLCHLEGQEAVNLVSRSHGTARRAHPPKSRYSFQAMHGAWLLEWRASTRGALVATLCRKRRVGLGHDGEERR
jgi:hypothetical protein